MHLSYVISALQLAIVCSFAAPDPPAPSLPQQYEAIHEYIRLHRRKTYTMPVAQPRWMAERFFFDFHGIPGFQNREEQNRWKACATYYGIPDWKIYKEFNPYKTPLAQERMEICVLYALGMIDDKAVEAKVTLDEVVRRHGLADDDYILGPEDFERWSDPVEEKRMAAERQRQGKRKNSPSEFSLDNVGRQVIQYMQPGGARGGGGGGGGGGTPRPALRIPH